MLPILSLVNLRADLEPFVNEDDPRKGDPRG